ncbi:Transcriptional regulator, TetR family OS=Tsukamurella paurometabola (strain ATCC 8368 / DSM/ CCUG 35730 / CIP 100753 / JCM 10117 / KCTC 9821 / NBRC 16120/ NCIMB 702349 / NCTC 13040) OX=521096 GN=Tpau_4118 PE=4 SV=1 [Tsukamurella paurometabola]|uniref:Transcriptional regulator, TetR family n=1 Tax=Tsukamurella paurometabola (strain ATCC 8368 / DSM 20162 / CCUG 35730 / CIP 100753 / JCM 10117 / KCTC 9821 / NBRC 16120 / NCIMB 702349 / NCTC 13040) TaxID=521096 RepID=D5UNX8_TSUPD|nr:transcriptional regulator, TetR family [Tsukamurella paurometabola DSM 20162]SUP40575.1 transcriptional regulator BetI [Tsukamurella paurometabola]
MPVTDLPATDTDLTAKARIRNAALELFAAHGESGVSLRAVAAHAGVAVGLVQHHFKTKEGLRAAVEQQIVEYHAQAIAGVPDDGPPPEVASARDAAVRQMLARHPAVVDYLRRSFLDPGGSDLLIRLTELGRSEVVRLRAAQLASTERAESDQVIGLMVRQMGTLFLQPLIDAMWEHLRGPDAPSDEKPQLSVTTAPGRAR